MDSWITVPGTRSPAHRLVSDFFLTDISHTLTVDMCQEACVQVVLFSFPTSHVYCQLWLMWGFFVSPGDKAFNHICNLPQRRKAANALRYLNLSNPRCISRCSSLEWNGWNPSLRVCACVSSQIFMLPYVHGMWYNVTVDTEELLLLLWESVKDCTWSHFFAVSLIIIWEFSSNLMVSLIH